MQRIKAMFGPFDKDEIEFYIQRLTGDDKGVIHEFQEELIFNIFYKYFGDTMSVNTINEEDYVILMLSAKMICEKSKYRYLPFIFSSKIVRYVKRTKLNKKEKDLMISSPYFKMIQEKYRNKKAEEKAEEYAATLLYSDFQLIGYRDDEKEIDKQILPKFPEYAVDEILKYILLIS